MVDHIYDWLALLGRWAHILTGIAWIGSSFFFMWLDAGLEKHDELEEGVEGELFLVHSGGYYKIHKKLFGHGQLPKMLHWFKWEAAFTVITGYFLLGVVYYAGGSTMMVDDTIADISGAAAIIIGFGGLVVSWFLYDWVWTNLGRKGFLPTLITGVLIMAFTFLFTMTLSGRAAYIHIGAMLGTWMVLNVWVHIIPNQRKMLNQAKASTPVDYSLGEQAKYRSVHNNYFTLPVIFIMISNHYPMTFGHEFSWVIIVLMFVQGAFIRHYFNLTNSGEKSKMWVFVPSGLAFVVTFMMTAPDGSFTSSPSLEAKKNHGHHHPHSHAGHSHHNAEAKKITETELNKEVETIKNDTKPYTTTIKGFITFVGNAPTPKKLKLPGACAKQHQGDVYQNDVQLNGDKLKNVMVYVSKGHESLQSPAPLASEVEVDQRGCIYIPRVSVVRAGRPVTFINSDPIFHNVKAMAKNNRRFNQGMPRKDQRMTKVFNKNEITVHAKCSVHPWMGAHIGVFDHQWFSKTDVNGGYTLPKLPEGKYTITFWHEVFGEKSKEVFVNSNDDLIINYSFN